MEMFKVNLHSAVDVITNSSTTIFTYSNGSDKKAKELIDELLKVLGSDLKSDDMFYMGVFLDEFNNYLERKGDDCWRDGKYDVELMKEEEYDEELIEALTDDNFSDYTLIEKVLRGEIEKPEWMTEAENYDDGDGFYFDTSLYVIPKKEEYTEVAKAITAFLYSTDHEAGYN